MRKCQLSKLTLPALSLYLLILPLTPVCANNPAEKRYTILTMQEANHIGRTITQFSNLLNNPRMGDRQWTNEVNACCQQMRKFSSEDKSILVPERCRAAHNYLTAALQSYTYIGYHFPDVLQTQNRQEGVACAEKIGKAGDDMIHYRAALRAKGILW